MKTTTARPATGPPSRPCQCTWRIEPHSAAVRTPPAHLPCTLHQQIQGEPEQPMLTGSRVPTL